LERIVKRKLSFTAFLLVIMNNTASAQIAPPPYTPNPMVWQQGINDNPQWRSLGCPHDYANDGEKLEMIEKGLCANANPDGSVKNPDAAVNGSGETWKILGCPRDYESDADLEAMKQAGLCKNVKVAR
jgi:hypothetical protein